MYHHNTQATNNNVLRSSRIENRIYEDLREQVNIGLDEIEAEGTAKLDTFPSLIQDIFVSLYGSNLQYNDVDTLTTGAREFNAVILDSVMNCELHYVLKSLCEGRELIAYEAIKAFAGHLLGKLDELLDASALDELNAAGNEQEIERLSRAVSRGIRIGKSRLQEVVEAAAEAAQIASDTVEAWGTDASSPAALQQNAELLRKVQSSEKLRDIIRYLVRFREIWDNARKSSFTYGRDEKYDIVLGNDFTRAISSEYVYLATPETIPLFIRKVQRKTLKQYRKRERVTKGYGDIVVCIDESGSMAGERIAWAKAVALVLLEHAIMNNRSHAMVRFSLPEEFVTHIFTKENYTTDNIFDFAESFLCGGTDFETPLSEAAALIENKGFENADLMFITDGACRISNDFADGFHDKRSQLNFKITSIVIGTDAGSSLEPFCEKVYCLDMAAGDSVACDIITSFTR